MADISKITGMDNITYDIKDTVARENKMTKGVDYVTAGQLTGSTLGTKATVEGFDNTASGDYSHAEGTQSIASGIVSHAEGTQCTASGGNSHAEGQHTNATGSFAHAEGSRTTAGSASHSEGQRVYVTGSVSHGEGDNNFVNSGRSHVQGTGHIVDVSQNDTSVLGVYSLGTTETGKTISVTPKNEDGSDSGAPTSRTLGKYAEVVGNGDSDTQRSNARTLDWSGNEWLSGNITAAGGSITVGSTTITESQLIALLALLSQS